MPLEGFVLQRLQDVSDDIVDETEATTPMIENANAIVSIIYESGAYSQLANSGDCQRRGWRRLHLQKGDSPRTRA